MESGVVDLSASWVLACHMQKQSHDPAFPALNTVIPCFDAATWFWFWGPALIYFPFTSFSLDVHLCFWPDSSYPYKSSSKWIKRGSAPVCRDLPSRAATHCQGPLITQPEKLSFGIWPKDGQARTQVISSTILILFVLAIYKEQFKAENYRT